MAAKLKKYLTDEFLERLKPSRGARLEYGDSACKGLVVRVTEAGRKSFSVIYRVKGDGGVTPEGKLLRGKQQRITLGEYPVVTIEEARKQALHIAIKADKGEDPRKEAINKNLLRNANSFEAVADKFIELHAKQHTVAWKNAERILKRYAAPMFGRKPVDAITRTDVHNLLDKLVKDGKVGVAREARKHLCTLFNWAINREICSINPALNMGRKDIKPNEDAGRSLDDDEIRAVWHGAERMGYPFGPMFQILLLTGQRKSEFALARIGEINQKEGYLEIPSKRYKGRRDHIVPFSEEVKRLLATLPEWTVKDYALFSTTGGKKPVSGFGHAKARLDSYVIDEYCKIKNDRTTKLKPYRVHDFRVTCETRLANLGYSQEIRDRVLGHAAPGLQKTYNKYDYTNEKLAALQAFAGHIMGIVNEQK